MTAELQTAPPQPARWPWQWLSVAVLALISLVASGCFITVSDEGSGSSASITDIEITITDTSDDGQRIGALELSLFPTLTRPEEPPNAFYADRPGIHSWLPESDQVRRAIFNVPRSEEFRYLHYTVRAPDGDVSSTTGTALWADNTLPIVERTSIDLGDGRRAQLDFHYNIRLASVDPRDDVRITSCQLRSNFDSDYELTWEGGDDSMRLEAWMNGEPLALNNMVPSSGSLPFRADSNPLPIVGGQISLEIVTVSGSGDEQRRIPTLCGGTTRLGPDTGDNTDCRIYADTGTVIIQSSSDAPIDLLHWQDNRVLAAGITTLGSVVPVEADQRSDLDNFGYLFRYESGTSLLGTGGVLTTAPTWQSPRCVMVVGSFADGALETARRALDADVSFDEAKAQLQDPEGAAHLLELARQSYSSGAPEVYGQPRIGDASTVYVNGAFSNAIGLVGSANNWKVATESFCYTPDWTSSAAFCDNGSPIVSLALCQTYGLTQGACADVKPSVDDQAILDAVRALIDPRTEDRFLYVDDPARAESVLSLLNVFEIQIVSYERTSPTTASVDTVATGPFGNAVVATWLVAVDDGRWLVSVDSLCASFPIC